MTKLLPYPTIQNTAADGAGAPGAAPNGAQMQGNPASSQFTPSGNYPPQPITGGAGQTVNSPLSHDQIARGNIPHNAQASNVGGAPGNDSLMAAMSRGQVLLNQSTYGQGGFVPQNGGSSPQAQQPGAVNTVSQANGIASTLTTAPAPIGD